MGLTADQLDEARDRVELLWGVGGHATAASLAYPEYACRQHGHFDCAFWPNGPCVAEATAEMAARLWPEVSYAGAEPHKETD